MSQIVTTPDSKRELHKMKISSGPVAVYRSAGNVIFDVINYILLGAIAITTLLPFIYIIGASFATEYELTTRPMFIIPHDVSTAAYEYIFSSNRILKAFGNSAFITVCGTLINLFFTVTMAYALSKTRLRGRNFFLTMVIVSMFFSGGMIPGYIVNASWYGITAPIRLAALVTIPSSPLAVHA